jgi:hypothetical protein
MSGQNQNRKNGIPSSQEFRDALDKLDCQDDSLDHYEENILQENLQYESTTENEFDVSDEGVGHEEKEEGQSEFDEQDDENIDQGEEDDREKELRNHDLVANLFGKKKPKIYILLSYNEAENTIEIRPLCDDPYISKLVGYLREIFDNKNIKKWKPLVKANDKDHLQILKNMKLNKKVAEELKKNKGLKYFSHKLIILPDGTPFSFKLFLPDERGHNKKSASLFTKIDEASWEKAFEAVWEDEKTNKVCRKDSEFGRALREKLNSVDKKCFDDALKKKDEDPNKVLRELVRSIRNKFKKNGVRFKDLDKRFREIYRSQIPCDSESNTTDIKLINYIVKNNSFSQDEIGRLEKEYKKRFTKSNNDIFKREHGFNYDKCKEIFKQVKPKLAKPETKVAFKKKSERKNLEDQQ